MATQSIPHVSIPNSRNLRPAIRQGFSLLASFYETDLNHFTIEILGTTFEKAVDLVSEFLGSPGLTAADKVLFDCPTCARYVLIRREAGRVLLTIYRASLLAAWLDEQAAEAAHS